MRETRTEAPAGWPGPGEEGRGPTGPELADLADLAGREVQELWFALAEHPWRSVVLVPASPGLLADDVAVSLASIGRRLGFTSVSPVLVEQLDFASVSQLASRVAAPSQSSHPGVAGSTAQLVVSIPPVVVQPLGVAVARAADVVVLCLSMGTTRLDEVRRTMALVGRERIGGCVLCS